MRVSWFPTCEGNTSLTFPYCSQKEGSETEAGTLDLLHSSAENELLETQKPSDKLLLESLVENWCMPQFW